MHHRKWLLAAIALGATLLPGVARADCAAGGVYTVTVAAHTVTVCPTECDATGQLLRQDEATGAVDVIDASCDGSGCYVDECVPAGTYRYGYATPFACSDDCGGAAYFGEGTVSDTGVTTCTTPTPTPATGAPPWGSASDPSNSVKCSSGGGCSTSPLATRWRTRTQVLGFDLAALGVGLAVMRLRRKKPARDR